MLKLQLRSAIFGDGKWSEIRGDLKVWVGVCIIALSWWLLAIIIGTLLMIPLVFFTWNVLELHSVFEVNSFTVVEVAGVALAINIICGILGHPVISWKGEVDA